MKKIGCVVFILILLACETTKETDAYIDLSMYKNGWEFIGIDETDSISYGTYFQTPFYTKVIEKNKTTIVLEVVEKDILYFDMLDPKEVKNIEIGQFFSPDEPMFLFPKKFDRKK